MSMMAGMLCGANFILHSAGWLEGGLAMGYEKFMMDLDFCGAAAHASWRACRSTTTSSPWTASPRSGPGKHFFSAQHTLRHYETAFYEARTQPTTTAFEQWRDAGESRAPRSGRRRSSPRRSPSTSAPPIDEAVDEALREFVDRTKASMPDQWY